MKLSTRIVTNIVVLVLLICLGIGITGILISYSVVNKIARESLITQAEMAKKLVEMEIESRLALLLDVVDKPELRSLDWRIQQQELINDVERLDYLDLGVMDADGTVRYVLGNETTNLGDRNYAIKALQGIPNVSDVLISRVTDKPVMMFAVPIKNDGEIRQILIGRKDGFFLSEITSPMKFGESGYTYLINRNGVVIAHDNKDYVINEFSPIKAAKEDPSMNSLGEAFSFIIANDKGVVDYDFNNLEVVTGFSSSDNTDWILVTTMAKNELLSGIYTHSTFVIFGTLVLLLAGIIIALIIGRSISKPIATMVPILENVSEGNLTKRVQIKSKDELGFIADTFNQSIEGLSQIVSTTKNAAGKLDAMSNDLISRMNDTMTSMDRIGKNIQKVKEQARSQSESVSETNKTMGGIKNLTDDLNNLISSQASAIVESSAAIEEMVANIKSVTDILQKSAASMEYLLKASDSGKQEIQRITGIIKTIEDDSDGLIEASNVIQNIAQQTNLLSMNAAIEAAHAGESGKGFSVVAGEIRKLAENSSEQGKSITAVLNNLKQRINSAVEVSDKAQEQFAQIFDLVKQVQEHETTIKHAMEEQTIGSGQILEAVKAINDITSQVKDGSGNMIAGSEEVLREMQNVIVTTHEVDISMDDMSTNLGDINNAIQSVNALTQETKSSIDMLSGEVEKFIV